MSTNEMNFKVKELRELRRMREELDAESAAAEDSIKAEMTARDVDTLAGDDWKITWRTVRGSRFDSAAFKKANPEAYALFKSFVSSAAPTFGSIQLGFQPLFQTGTGNKDTASNLDFRKISLVDQFVGRGTGDAEQSAEVVYFIAQRGIL